MNHATSQYLNRPLRAEKQYSMDALREYIGKAEIVAKHIRDHIPMHLDACSRCEEMLTVLSNLYPDYIVPIERALEGCDAATRERVG